MKEHFSEQLEDLRRQLILMGGEVERQIHAPIEALTEMDAEKARGVIAADEEIDRMEMAIEESAISLLALQQPVAVDLRFLVGALKINSDLERIGDHAVNIAEGAERLAGQRPFKPFIDIPYMAEVAMSMLKQSLDAFVNRDADLARKVIKKDDILDEKNVSIIRELLTYIAEYPALTTYCIELISISKNLERVGDLATNICEDTIFIAEARWVKHHATETARGSSRASGSAPETRTPKLAPFLHPLYRVGLCHAVFSFPLGRRHLLLPDRGRGRERLDRVGAAGPPQGPRASAAGGAPGHRERWRGDFALLPTARRERLPLLDRAQRRRARARASSRDDALRRERERVDVAARGSESSPSSRCITTRTRAGSGREGGWENPDERRRPFGGTPRSSPRRLGPITSGSGSR